jgi:hypothetical protein
MEKEQDILKSSFITIIHLSTERSWRIEYCSTDQMIGDSITKPLMGAKFKEFRKQIINFE